ncbi:MAG: ATP-binding cassette domain-containing protein [Anaerolineae bacterium]|nr:ATP-binding cassette domain-containing protein [Anaerolineae bacterium]
MDDMMIEICNLRKQFLKRKVGNGGSVWSRLKPRGRQTKEWIVAVDGISLDIRRGEIFGLLGPNGAGKTTTIKMLCTLLEPTGGTACVNGYDVVKQAGRVRQNLGAVLTGERSIYWKLTGRENLRYFAALYHIPPTAARQRVDELLKRFNLQDRADECVEKYSSGMKQRVAIARSLLANPPVLLLDEPTVGLDPQAARNLRELILEIREEGCTVLLTTHYMEEADQLCDRVGIIDQGNVIALDAPGALKTSINQLDVMQVEVENYDPALTESLKTLPTVENVLVHHLGTDSVWSLSLHAEDSRVVLPQLIELVGSRAGRIRNLEIAQPSLEDVFISLTGKQLRD